MVVKAAQLLEYGAATHPVGGGAITPGCQGLGKAEKALIIRKDRPFSFSFFEEADTRSEEHTSDLQSLMRISYAVFCLKQNKQYKHPAQCLSQDHATDKNRNN